MQHFRGTQKALDFEARVVAGNGLIQMATGRVLGEGRKPLLAHLFLDGTPSGAVGKRVKEG
jgi:hypothetical protein